MSTPFKMKAGSSPMKHFFGKHPSKKDGHKRSDHKAIKKGKKIAKTAGHAGAEVVTEAHTQMIQNIMNKEVLLSKKK